MRTFKTEDGFTFYMQEDGSLTDTRDASAADHTYANEGALVSAVDAKEVPDPALIAERKLIAHHALESLINRCERELRNLEYYEDDRSLIATTDLQSRLDSVVEAADAFEEAFFSAGKGR